MLLSSRYPDDPSSIPRKQQVWLERPSTPLVLREVFNRRKNFVMADLHVLLVTPDQNERLKMRTDLEKLGYKTTAASSGKVAQDLLSARGGEFHVGMVSVALSSEHSSGEGPDCAGLLAWVRDTPSLKEVSMIALGSYSIDAAHTIQLVRCGAIDVLTKPVPSEALMRLRHAVGHLQSLQQQRFTARGDGGPRLVTSYLLRKEREAPGTMGLPLSVLERKEGNTAYAPNSTPCIAPAVPHAPAALCVQAVSWPPSGAMRSVGPCVWPVATSHTLPVLPCGRPSVADCPCSLCAA